MQLPELYPNSYLFYEHSEPAVFRSFEEKFEVFLKTKTRTKHNHTLIRNLSKIKITDSYTRHLQTVSLPID